MGVEQTRIQTLNDAEPDPDGRYVLYWMQASQRAEHNPALAHAIERADELDRPVLVVFGLDEDHLEANERSFAFLLEGLAETAEALAERGIKLVLRRGEPGGVALELAEQAACVVCDRGYLRHAVRARKRVARVAGCRVEQVEGDVVVPIEVASDHAEYAARTIRPKIEAHRDTYLRALTERTPGKQSLPLHVTSELDPRRPEAVLAALDVDRSVGRVGGLVGGTSQARRALTRFLRSGLPGYASRRNDPADPSTSRLSPYLHFGQISPVEVARKASRASGPSAEDREAFLEELIVRRELACNFVAFTDDYDRFSCLPDWARKTLAEHEDDERPHRYTARQLEAAETHDPAWNAAMEEMKRSGFLESYMRMYWGKKILEWSNTPQYAHRVALALNNKYLLDGRDPSSYSNVAWLFGLHDRAWAESEVYGKVRRMTADGLARKFDVDAYVERVASLGEAEEVEEAE